MRNIILFSLGVGIISFTGCSTANINKKVEVKKVEKSSKTVVKKNSEEVEKKRVVNDYKTVVDENIKRSKNQKEATNNFEKTQKTLLNEMELARKNFAKTEDLKKYIKVKNRITKELNAAQEKLDRTIKSNEIINYTENKNTNDSH